MFKKPVVLGFCYGKGVGLGFTWHDSTLVMTLSLKSSLPLLTKLKSSDSKV